MANKSGYINIDENEEITIEESKLSNSVTISEQEVCINFMRDEDYATIYTSDTTYMTKLALVPENLWFYIIPPYGG